MLNSLVKIIFKLITSLFNALLSPIISLVTGLFPSLGSLFNVVSTFLNYCFTYIRSILSLLCIPDTYIITLFDYFVICYSIYYTILAVRFAITIYNKFKL